MAKKDSKLVHAAHIKRRTEGTSNELSFSVLDAKKNQADVAERKDIQAQDPRIGGIPVFAWHPGKRRTVGTPTKEPSLPLLNESGEMSALGDATSSTPLIYDPSVQVNSDFSFASSEDEIERRKTRRRKRRVLTSVIGSVVVLALVGGGGFFLHNEITNYQEQVDVLGLAFEKVKKADETILIIDQMLAKPLEERDIIGMEALVQQIPDAITQLDEANEYAAKASGGMLQGSEKSTAEQALTTIDARKQMLGASESILNASIQVTYDKESLSQAWSDVVEGDKISREAAALVTNTTSENVGNSMEKSAEAKTLFEEAAYLLNQLNASSLNLDTKTFQDYVSKRIEACNYAIASDEAILAQDRKKAEAQNDAYNAADGEASALARTIPEEPSVLIDQAYERHIADKKKLYSEMRSSASTADAFLRDYLGTASK